MMPLPLVFIVAHFVGDFLLQADWMALNKSKDNIALACHSYIVAFITGIGATFLLSPGNALWFVFITFITHFCTDYVTSRITSRLWFFSPVSIDPNNIYHYYYHYIDGRRHWFFVVIGFDQLLHYTQLAITYRLLM